MNIKLFIPLIFSLAVIACKNRNHHLIYDATTATYHSNDTIGWGQTLDHLHGVWVSADYMNSVNTTKSIFKANQSYPNQFVALNIDTRRFRSDSLDIIGVGTQDSAASLFSLHFSKNEWNEDIKFSIKNHPTYDSDFSTFHMITEVRGWDTLIHIQERFDGSGNAKTTFKKITHDVSNINYQSNYWYGLEVFMREQYIIGKYDIYNINNRLVKRGLSFNIDGTIGELTFHRYHVLGWSSFDMMMLESFSPTDNQLNRNRFYGFVIRDNGFELHHVKHLFSPDKQPILDSLAFRFVKR